MYFFSEEERKYLLKKLIPSTRERGIAEDLRGWNWHCSELSPPHDILMPSGRSRTGTARQVGTLI